MSATDGGGAELRRRLLAEGDAGQQQQQPQESPKQPQQQQQPPECATTENSDHVGFSFLNKTVQKKCCAKIRFAIYRFFLPSLVADAHQSSAHGTERDSTRFYMMHNSTTAGSRGYFFLQLLWESERKTNRREINRSFSPVFSVGSAAHFQGCSKEDKTSSKQHAKQTFPFVRWHALYDRKV